MMKKIAHGCLVAAVALPLGGLVVLFVAGFISGLVYTKPEETTVATAAAMVLSMDYDRDTESIYYVDAPEIGGPETDRMKIVRHDGATAQVLREQTRGVVGWVSVSRRGTLYVLDLGDNWDDTPWVKTAIPPTILEMDGTRVVRTIPILNPTLLLKRVGQEERTRETITSACVAAIEASSSQTPLGIASATSFLRSLGTAEREKEEALLTKTPIVFLPKFLVLGSADGPEVAVSGEDCGVEAFRGFQDRLLRENLSRINEAAVADTEEAQKALDQGGRGGWAYVVDKKGDFALRSVPKGPLEYYLYNFPCERYYDQIKWGWSRMNMGSCSGGVTGVPESFDVFTAAGDFIYFRYRGVYRLSKTHDHAS
jgi:hypothetical protein